MSIYIDQVHIYCDHEGCDSNTMINPEELGSMDFGRVGKCRVGYQTLQDIVGDFAFAMGWMMHPDHKLSCPNCDDGGS